MTEQTTQSAAAPRKEAAGITKRSSSYHADPKMITRRPGFNARFDFGDIERLAGQIKSKKEKDPASGGLIHDLHVKRIATTDPRFAQGFIFEIVDGDRRLTAIELLMKKGEIFDTGIPIKIVDKSQSEIDDLIQMFVANDGKSFLPLEEAAAYQRMRDAGMSVKAIGEAVGRKHVHVIQILALVNADESLKQAVADKKIGKTMAKEIAQVARGDKAKQKELTLAAVAAGSDKGKRRVLLKTVQATRTEKAAKRGRVLKIHVMDAAALNELGDTMAKALPKKLMTAKAVMHADALDKWIAGDAKLIAAFTYGALQALKSAAGAKAKLEF